MKHDGNHKLDIACMQCVKKHIEHKEKLLVIVKKLVNFPDGNYTLRDLLAESAQLLKEIEADND